MAEINKRKLEGLDEGDHSLERSGSVNARSNAIEYGSEVPSEASYDYSDYLKAYEPGPVPETEQVPYDDFGYAAAYGDAPENAPTEQGDDVEDPAGREAEIEQDAVDPGVGEPEQGSAEVEQGKGAPDQEAKNKDILEHEGVDPSLVGLDAGSQPQRSGMGGAAIGGSEESEGKRASRAAYNRSGRSIGKKVADSAHPKGSHLHYGLFQGGDWAEQSATEAINISVNVGKAGLKALGTLVGSALGFVGGKGVSALSGFLKGHIGGAKGGKEGDVYVVNVGDQLLDAEGLANKTGAPVNVIELFMDALNNRGIGFYPVEMNQDGSVNFIVKTKNKDEVAKVLDEIAGMTDQEIAQENAIFEEARQYANDLNPHELDHEGDGSIEDDISEGHQELARNWKIRNDGNGAYSFEYNPSKTLSSVKDVSTIKQELATKKLFEGSDYTVDIKNAKLPARMVSAIGLEAAAALAAGMGIATFTFMGVDADKIMSIESTLMGMTAEANVAKDIREATEASIDQLPDQSLTNPIKDRNKAPERTK